MSRKAAKTTSRASRRPSPSTRAITRSRVSVAKPAHRRKPEAEGAAALGMNAKKTTQRQGFKTHEFIVYPAHGVGQIVAIEEQDVAGVRLELFVINFVKDKMTLRVPTSKVASVGMRKLAETPMVKQALGTLKGRARIKRTMWSRRAQEYEAKINSGDIVAIAEVVRDLYRSETQPEQSYSERQLVRSRARPDVPRDCRGAADRRDRSGQGNRGCAGQGPASRSEAGSRRRGSGRGRGGLAPATSRQTKRPGNCRAFLVGGMRPPRSRRQNTYG